MTPEMAYAARKMRIWDIAKLWNCTPWEVGKRPAREVLEVNDLLNAKGIIAKGDALHAELQAKLGRGGDEMGYAAMPLDYTNEDAAI